MFVCLPGIAGIIAVCVRYYEFLGSGGAAFTSVLQRGEHNQVWTMNMLWSLGPALHTSVLGMLLVLFFLSRLSVGIAKLPLSLGQHDKETAEEENWWKRAKIVIWISLIGMPAISTILGFATEAFLRGWSHLVGQLAPVDAPVGSIFAAAALACIAGWASGEPGWEEYKRFISIPGWQGILAGIGIPAAIYGVPKLILYSRDRAHWAAFEFGRISPPALSAFFDLPAASALWFVAPALAEEVIWRGFLQSHFIRRFGLIRGIVLLALVWSGFHFLSDFQRTTSDYQVLLTMTHRIALCLAMSFVFGWLTIRWGSIWPAVLAHWLHNVLVVGAPSELHHYPALQTPWPVMLLCYGALAIALFKYWPPSDLPSPEKPFREFDTASAA